MKIDLKQSTATLAMAAMLLASPALAADPAGHEPGDVQAVSDGKTAPDVKACDEADKPKCEISEQPRCVGEKWECRVPPRML